eukprot:358759-Chlamydomonas_euryale.AAC.2
MPQITVHEDSTSKCLVCSRDMYDFEHDTRTGFKFHVERHHDPISYIFYIHYLRNTRRNDFGGVDAVVDKLLHESVRASVSLRSEKPVKGVESEQCVWGGEGHVRVLVLFEMILIWRQKIWKLSHPGKPGVDKCAGLRSIPPNRRSGHAGDCRGACVLAACWARSVAAAARGGRRRARGVAGLAAAAYQRAPGGYGRGDARSAGAPGEGRLTAFEAEGRWHRTAGAPGEGRLMAFEAEGRWQRAAGAWWRGWGRTCG